ncbi:MAG: hypothetical protein JWM69_1421 [Candidatus Binatus sp.]|nr:hypothetical protein [Candidatus Binatus sp.]
MDTAEVTSTSTQERRREDFYGTATRRTGSGLRDDSRTKLNGKMFGLHRRQQVQLARGLGWFSIALGLAEAAMPRRVGQLAGVRNHSRLIRLLGTRELATGIGILGSRRIRPNSLWARVAGDVMDLAVLGAAAREYTTDRRRLSIATAAVAGVTLLDVLCAEQLTKDPYHNMSSSGIDLQKAVTVNRPADELYRFWRQLENLPRFMKHLNSVKQSGDTYHWDATGPAGARVQWDARIVEDRPGEMISWRSLENSEVDASGTVHFEKHPPGRGTIVRLLIHYRPPAGSVGSLIAGILGEAPASQIGEDLRRFKQLIETGEIPTTQGQPSGRRSLAVSVLRSMQQPLSFSGETR